MANRPTSLFAFVQSLENLVSRWRKNEEEKDHWSNQGAPTLSNKSSQLLKKASQKYTSTMYKKFKEGFKEGEMVSDIIRELQCSTILSCYDVRLYGNDKVSQVLFDASSLDIKCSCYLFETMGIICAHAFKVLLRRNIHVIPEKYYLKRWCIDARDRVEQPYHSHASLAIESEMVYSNRLMRIVHELVMDSKASPETRMIVDKGIKDVVANLKPFQTDNMPSQPSRDEADAIVKDPLLVKSKGISNERFKRHREKTQTTSIIAAVGGTTKKNHRHYKEKERRLLLHLMQIPQLQ